MNHINGISTTTDTNGSSQSENPAASGNELQIAIVGGGIVGLITAIGLLSRGVFVKVYEQARSLREIGAGVAFTGNAQRCMELLDPNILRAMKVVSTANTSVYYSYVDGFHAQSDQPDDTSQREMFQLPAAGAGFYGCHRAQFLEQLFKLVPQGVVEFRKKLETCSFGEDNDLVTMRFEDETTATADAVIGCDGIRSRVRQVLLGRGNPASYPGYSNKFVFRGLVQMDKAIAALGKDRVHTQTLHMGPQAHIVHYPIARQTLLNVVAFITDNGEWPHQKMTAPGTREEVTEIFKDWTPAVRSITSLLEDSLDKWAIFDTYDNPAPFYSLDRVCVAGDAAHASSPHLGAGAGFGVEDALTLATLIEEVASTLKEEGIGSCVNDKASALVAAFKAYDETRRERTQWLVRNSRHVCDIYQWADPTCGTNSKKCLEEIEWRTRKVWYFDIESIKNEARAAYEKNLRV